MKTLPDRNTAKNTASSRVRNWGRSSDRRRKHAEISWLPPPLTHRRYPSLSEDFERLPPLNRPTHTKSTISPNPSPHGASWRISSVRAVALIAILVIIVALLVNA